MAIPSALMSQWRPTEKKNTQYALEMVQEFARTATMNDGWLVKTMTQVQTNRNYAKGTQDMTKYIADKQMRGGDVKDDTVRKFQTALSQQLNKTPKKLLQTPIDSAVGQITPKRRSFTVRANDPESVRHRNGILQTQAGMKFLQEARPDILQALQIGDKPLPADLMALPSRGENIDLEHERTAVRILYSVFYVMNNWEEIERTLNRNMLVDGFGIVKVEANMQGGINLRVVDNATFFTARPNDPTMKDVAFCGEVHYYEPHELAKMNARAEEPHPQKEFWDFISSKAGNYGNGYAIGGFVFPGYEPGRVPVIDIQWRDIHLKRGVKRNSLIAPIDADYMVKSGEELMEEIEAEVIYTAKWIPTSNYVLDFRVNDYTVRGDKSKGEDNVAFFDYVMYCPSINKSDGYVSSAVEAAIPFVENYTMADINYQQELVMAMPTAYEYPEAMITMISGLFGTQAMDSLDFVRALHSMGVVISPSVPNGSVGTPGVGIVQGGISDNAEKYARDKEIAVAGIADIMGIPKGLDGTAPSEQTAVKNQQATMSGALNNLTKYAVGIDSIISGVAHRVIKKAQQIIREIGMETGATSSPLLNCLDWSEELILMQSEGFFNSEFSYSVRSTPTSMQMEKIEQTLNLAIETGQLNPGQKYEILHAADDDYDYAMRLMKEYTDENAQKAAKIAQENSIAQVKAQQELETVKHQGMMEEIAGQRETIFGKEDKITEREYNLAGIKSHVALEDSENQTNAKIKSAQITADATVAGKKIQRLQNADGINADKELGNIDIESLESKKPQMVKKTFYFKRIPYDIIVTNSPADLWKYASKIEGSPITKEWGLNSKSGFEGFSNVTPSGRIFSILNEADPDFNENEIFAHESVHVSEMLLAQLREPNSNLYKDPSWADMGEAKSEIPEEMFAEVSGEVAVNMRKVYDMYEAREV